MVVRSARVALEDRLSGCDFLREDVEAVALAATSLETTSDRPEKPSDRLDEQRFGTEPAPGGQDAAQAWLLIAQLRSTLPPVGQFPILTASPAGPNGIGLERVAAPNACPYCVLLAARS